MSGKNWWNSAISGLESRLDTILAEDGTPKPAGAGPDAAARTEGADKAATDKKLAVEPASRNSSRSRPNSRLQDRLAKAVNKGSEARTSSDLGSRPASPAVNAVTASPRASIDSKAPEPVTEVVPSKEEATTVKEDEATKSDGSKAGEPSQTPQPAVEAPAPIVSPPATSPPPTPLVAEQPKSTPVPTMSMPSIPSIVTPQTSSPRQSFDSDPSRPSVDAITPTPPPEAKDPEEIQVELSLLQNTYQETLKDNREELNAHLERIDALQSKLTYMSEQLAASAKAAKSDSGATPVDKKLADKDAQIAALMEEGQKLSKTEMKHLTTIKKMRAKALEQDKEIATLKQRLTKAEKSITDQSERARRAEAAEKSAQEKLKIVGRIEKDIETIRAEREEAGLTISELRKQLSDALSRAEDAEKRVQSGALEAEKRLAEDRAKRELQAARDEAKSQQEKAKVAELELRGEIANLESKLELLRSRTEEASSSATGDSQAKLLRQIETLQTQYSLASENWQGIETTLTSRVAALEKDRDETAKRESDVRRKARDVNSKARRLEDELESINERARAFEHDLTEQRAAAQKLQARLTQAESAAQDAQAELEREKKVWEAELQQRIEDEKNKWKVEIQTPSLMGESQYLRTDSPSIAQRRHSPDPLGIYNRRPNPRSITSGMDLPMMSPMDRMFDEASRRPSSSRHNKSNKVRTPEIGTPQRQDSIPSSMSNLAGGGVPDTPSIHTIDHDNDPFENTSSPHRTINDMISVSTAGAGPSVQLVERMSAAVRRLESEKATHKEELARLTAQRDEAREEVVALMREVDEARKNGDRVADLEKRMDEMQVREEAALDMLGEKTERVEELEGDVRDLKKIYRELVDTLK
ncbi:hypothetical protein CC77DRAFT_597916 [Alternaria alternata]|uniref:TATA element modulatory factor 1 TATA binding domain-containing protein n=1 Tax=Alternaria alternata TaxID=5599 RepID=A0A177D2V4_ALTAL|nr:hypothetical protein CC77DRAFT_597916 [Alternaria alternata]OAG13791.1 hypothetical protein CC77DRAFT_597916 [Alternaria alternata]